MIVDYRHWPDSERIPAMLNPLRDEKSLRRAKEHLSAEDCKWSEELSLVVENASRTFSDHCRSPSRLTRRDHFSRLPLGGDEHEEITRIIGARRASRKERKRYESEERLTFRIFPNFPM
jgi:hypothetical protein